MLIFKNKIAFRYFGSIGFLAEVAPIFALLLFSSRTVHRFAPASTGGSAMKQKIGSIWHAATTFGRGRMLLGLALLSALNGGSTALAQDTNPPPRQSTESPTGVSYRNGSFTLQETDLTIGGEFPNGLSLTRSYNSSSDGISDPYYAAVGWTHSFNIYLSQQATPAHPDAKPQPYGIVSGRPPPLRDVEYAPNAHTRCIYNVTGGPKSLGFRNTVRLDDLTIGSPGFFTLVERGCGVKEGNYAPLGTMGATLEFITTPSPGFYRLTGSDGSVINLKSSGSSRATDWTMADGTRLDFTYDAGKLKSVFNSRGWAILFENEYKICAVNTAQTYIMPTSSCPANAQNVTYTYAPAVYATGRNLMTSATKDGKTTQYNYANNDHVNCIKSPGQMNCRIQNTYTACQEDPQRLDTNPIQPEYRLHDYVSSQIDAYGKTYNYTMSGNAFFAATNSCPAWQSQLSVNKDYRTTKDTTTTVTESGAGQTTVVTHPSGRVQSVTDALGRTSTFGYQTGLIDIGLDNSYIEHGDLASVYEPEGNGYFEEQDERGNIIRRTTAAKTGSGVANLVTASTFPVTCANIKTCNKPTSSSDARGATTDYSYDPAHGGVLTETGPADVNNIRPVKRSAYVQRYAWLKNSGVGYSQAAAPIWLLSEERNCKSSATIGNSCSGGSADEVVVTFDYGPDSGPNNLLLRGSAVTSGGITLRTCYAYDRDGRKISETSPNANLVTCP